MFINNTFDYDKDEDSKLSLEDFKQMINAQREILRKDKEVTQEKSNKKRLLKPRQFKSHIAVDSFSQKLTQQEMGTTASKFNSKLNK